MGGLSFGLHIALVISFVSLFAWGCDSGAIGSSSGTRRPAIVRPSGYHVVDVVNGGTLAGAVLWAGPLPEVVHVTVAHHAEACGPTRALGALTVSARGGVAGTVVYLDGITEGRAMSEAPVEVSFAACELTPRVIAMPASATLHVTNAEAVLHNLHATTAAGAVWADMGLPTLGADGVGIVPLGISTLLDDAGHPWIAGFVHAFAHPYFAVTDADGRFRIASVPPGQYTVRAWHEGVRAVNGETVHGRPRLSLPLVLTRPVALTSGSETTVDFQLDLAAVDAAGN